MNSTPRNDLQQILRAVKLLFPEQGVVELRCRKGKRITGGYFDDHTKLARAASGIREGNAYITLNSVDPTLLARRTNRVDYADYTTADGNILGRRWFLIDCDCQRPSGISATDHEHGVAVAKAKAIGRVSVARGWPQPVLCDSGNGGHLLFRIDLPNDDPSAKLVQRVLAQLAVDFDDSDDCSPCVKVDQSVFNASRICKLYGTVARKGDHTPDRPHRLSRILFTPDEVEIVTREQLEAYAGPEPPPPEPRQTFHANGRLDLREFIGRHLEVRQEGTYTNPNGAVYRWKLETCPLCGESDKSAVVLEFNDGRFGYRCHHNRCCGKGWSELREHFEPGYRERRESRGQSDQRIKHFRSPRADAAQADDETLATPKIVNLQDVEVRPVEWLWRGRIAIGKVSLLAGDPGLGKSLVTLDMAARVSTGRPWPDALEVSQTVGGVVLLSAEDDLGDTIKPRLLAHEADVSRIIALQSIAFRDGLGECERCVDLGRDIPAIETAISEVADCRLVVVDPISAFLGRIDSHKNADVRGVLAQLADLAERRRVAVVAVTHLRKGEGAAMYRAMGSLAFVAAARAVWAVCRAPQDRERCLVLPVKNNLARDTEGLAYSIRSYGSEDLPVVCWSGEPVTISADEALSPPPKKPGPSPQERTDAEVWLNAVLAAGPRLAKEVTEEAVHGQMISKRTLERASKVIGVISYRPENPGPWWWRLPQSTSPSAPCVSEPGDLGDVPRNSANLDDSEGAECHIARFSDTAAAPSRSGRPQLRRCPLVRLAPQNRAAAKPPSRRFATRFTRSSKNSSR